MTEAPLAPAVGTRVTVEAPAKVNLFLRILERTPDGFHRLETLFQAVGLCDALTLEVVEGSSLDLSVEGADVGTVEENLVTRAIRLFEARTGRRCGLRVQLRKEIPTGAGLGGGSTDAGATLRALNLLHGSPVEGPELVAMGGTLGADVAFFAGAAGRALGEGRGERLTPLPPLPTRTLVLGLPPVHVPTGPAYGALARARVGRPVPRPVLPASLDTWTRVEASAVNDFETVVPPTHPAIEGALVALRQAGAATALLSGSGSAVFGLFPRAGSVDEVLDSLRASRPETRWRAVPTLEGLPAPARVEPERPIH